MVLIFLEIKGRGGREGVMVQNMLNLGYMYCIQLRALSENLTVGSGI
jgi:hypothetical protein